MMILTRPPHLNIAQTGDYWQIITNLIKGQGYSMCDRSYFPFCGPSNQVTATREPAPVLFFTLSALLFPNNLVAAAVLELVLFIGILIALYLLTKRLAGIRTALLASLIWAAYLPGLKLVPQISGDLMGTLGITVGIYFVSLARKTDLNRDWILAGAGLGLAVMSRSASLVIVLVMAMGLLVESWSKHGKWLEWLRPSFLIVLITAVMMFPWLVRNQVEFGKPVLGSSLTGYNIYRQNFIVGSPNYLHYVGASEGAQAIQSLLERRPDLLGTENEAQMDLVYRQEGLKIIFAHPIKYLALSTYRFLPLWFNWGISEAYGTPESYFDYLIMVEQAFLLFLALFGAFRQKLEIWPLWAGILGISLAYMSIDCQLRYLVSVMPLVICLAGIGLVKIFEPVPDKEDQAQSA